MTYRLPAAESADRRTDPVGPAKAVYILMLPIYIGIVFAVIGLFIALAQRKSAPEWLQSHYAFQVIAFGLLMGSTVLLLLVGWALDALGVAVLLLLALNFWYIVRCCRGLLRLGVREAVPKPWSLLMGNA
jgi:uncharacterized membrane protein